MFIVNSFFWFRSLKWKDLIIHETLNIETNDLLSNERWDDAFYKWGIYGDRRLYGNQDYYLSDKLVFFFLECTV